MYDVQLTLNATKKKFFCEQCADIGGLVEKNKFTADSSSYDAPVRIWTGIEIIAQLEVVGITLANFAEVKVSLS